jgi:hypothetical protein
LAVLITGALFVLMAVAAVLWGCSVRTQRPEFEVSIEAVGAENYIEGVLRCLYREAESRGLVLRRVTVYIRDGNSLAEAIVARLARRYYGLNYLARNAPRWDGPVPANTVVIYGVGAERSPQQAIREAAAAFRSYSIMDQGVLTHDHS